MDNETEGTFHLSFNYYYIFGYFEFKIIYAKSISILYYTESDCLIDAAHDMGVLSADFCKLYHTDRKF